MNSTAKVTRKIRSGDAELQVEAIGDPKHPCVILVMGALASMLWWPDAFCEAVAARGRYVLRFDNRDTGLSTKYPVGAPGYSLDDMADDVVAVLDNFGIARAQLVGASMGGIIGQIAGLKYPDRFTSLVVLSSTPLDQGSNLPGPSKEFLAVAQRGGKLDWNNREQVVKFMLEFGRVLAVTEQAFDEAAARALIQTDFDRSGGLAHGTNHFILKGGESWTGRLGKLQPPLHVLHGRVDPLFGIEHGRALAKAVPGSTLVELPGGHGLDRAAWEPVIEALADSSLSGINELARFS